MDAIKHYHPLVGFSFFLLMIALSLVSMQPVFQIISFLAVIGYSLAVSGSGAFVHGNWWIFVLIIIVILFNGAFSGQGLTVLFMLNFGFMQTPVTVESLVYGFSMGLMLANVILWFYVLGKLSSIQGFIELFSKVSPTAGMMIARITVFIPELLRHAKVVEKAQRVFIGRSEKRKRREQLAHAGVLSSNLMEWGMERSLITAQSMIARGYGSRKRTSYRRTRLTIRDLVPLAILLALGFISFVCIIWAGATYQFYPHLSPLRLWWGYTPFLLLILTPLVLQLVEELAWWRST